MALQAQQALPSTTPQAVGKRRKRTSHRQLLIDRGDLVSNAPLRARCEWLMAHDPEFSLVQVCLRLEEQGFTGFTKAKDGRVSGDTTRVLRMLGMRDPAPSVRNGRRYTFGRTQWLRYGVAVGLCRALNMDPVDGGV